MKNSAKKDKRYIFLLSKEGILSLLVIAVMSFFTAGFSLVSADKYQQQINALSQDNSNKQAKNNQLGVQASNLSDAISKLQSQIDAKQAIIYKHQQEVEKLKKEIAAAQKELDKQRKILGADIKAMYLEGDISTLEMLATSKNLSDYFDKQQYRRSVQEKVKNTLDRITQLKLDLNTKKKKTEELIAEQQQLKNQLVSQRSEKDHLLSLNQNQRAALDKSIRANNAKIAQLRAAQALANRQLSAGGAVVAGDPGHGGYPSVWANAPQDSRLDNWGMYNRECVSYTAWKVYQTFGFMPYWGGRGNANEWPGDARSAGIPTGSTPRVHSVAIWNVGYFGHAMWVEAVNGDGSLWVSQYNYDYHGHYSEMRVSASMAANLTYIYFR
ncbi:MAG TPA: CHAP domain-containing protein [Candidatus Saccharimonadales bacterium]|nr:CHAP domain-containing protein [Candidatus Saccharimonadales bacterium]